MQLGRYRIERAAQAASAVSPDPSGTDVKASTEVGASGTINMRGFLQQAEYNPDLRGRNGLKQIERMVRSDGAVKEAEGHIFQPILNAEWSIEPASTEPLDLEIAEFIRKSFFEWPVTPWQTYMGQVIKYLRYGHMVFEVVEQVVEDELVISPPRPSSPPPSSAADAQLQLEEARNWEANVTLPSRQFVTIQRFAQRQPFTIWKWNTEDGELVSIEQQVFKVTADGKAGYENIPIPAENLLVFTNDMDGEEFTGTSILRSAYKAWVMKELIEKIAGVAYELHGVGVMSAYMPKGREKDTALRDEIETMLKSVRAGEFSYLIWPGPKATSSTDGFGFEITSPSNALVDYTPILEYHRGEIKAAVLVRFSELGHAQTGLARPAMCNQGSGTTPYMPALATSRTFTRRSSSAWSTRTIRASRTIRN